MGDCVPLLEAGYIFTKDKASAKKRLNAVNKKIANQRKAYQDHAAAVTNQEPEVQIPVGFSSSVALTPAGNNLFGNLDSENSSNSLSRNHFTSSFNVIENSKDHQWQEVANQNGKKNNKSKASSKG
mmetsp:Transcript_34113/g.102012  ORF Transcript_34113/g.102012 Transcript_34113/m.102012 type:complete len:126 (-) Transcript_34113:7-384(-)